MNTEKEKMLAGELYSPVDRQLSEDRMHAKRLLQQMNVNGYLMNKEVAAVLRELIPHAPPDLYIEPPFHCDYGYNIYCSNRVYINVNCIFLDAASITIGSHVFIGPGVHIFAATHPMDPGTRRKKALAKPVVIGNDCWIGGGAIICPGVTIGNACVVGAGAVVTKDVPDNSVVAGNPARIIKSSGQSGTR